MYRSQETRGRKARASGSCWGACHLEHVCWQSVSILFSAKTLGCQFKKNIHSSAVLSVNLIDGSGVKFRYSPLP